MSQRFHIVAIGEVLWDIFPDDRRLGGAPANFAIHIGNLAGSAANVTLISAVGDDPLGSTTVGRLEKSGLSTTGIQTSSHATGRVVVTLQNESPQYEIADPAAWDDIHWNDRMAATAKSADVVCFGTLAQRFELELIAYTQGAQGATLLRGDEVNHVPGHPVSVVDTVGAGDAYTATLIWELLLGHDLATASSNACRVAAYVCSQNGATPNIPHEVYASNR